MYKEELKLIKHLLKGERKAFDQFYSSYFPKVFRFCRLRVDNEESCQDIVQQTMIAAIRAIESYRGEAALFTWICQICRNEISAWYKKTGKKQQLTSSLDQNPELRAALESIPGGLNGGHFDELFDIRELVVASLDQLPDNYSIVLQLKYIEGLSVDDIAQRMSTTVIAVQSLLARARTAFKRAFNDAYTEALA